jgi:hypothetical protein
MTRRGVARWERKEKKGEALRWGAPLIVARGGGRGQWKWCAGTATETVLKPWADKVVAVVQTWLARQCRCSEHVADERAHTVSYFNKLSKLAQTWKLKMDVLPCSKNSQCLHVATLGPYEQFSQLCLHPIPNRIRVENPGTDSTFESLLNFKRGLNLLKNLVNSLKFFLDLIFIKVNLVGITYI